MRYYVSEMDASAHFDVGKSRYDVKMWLEGEGGKWYEVWCEGTLLGGRNPWPIDPHTKRALTKDELVTDKHAFFVEQARRKGEASRP